MTTETAPVNRLILGDNLEILKTLESESVDLIYLDPPFFSNRNYEVIWGDEGEIRSFKDRWSGGIDHYIAWLKERVIEMHRVLKKTGSIFLHCDWHADAYIRVYVLDKIFGEKNFRNGIAWCYYSPTSPHIKQLPRKHDTIFWYSKGSKWIFNKDHSRIPFKDDKQTLRKRWGDDLSEEKVKEYREKGKVIEDFWTDIIQIGRSKAEIIGYPTQKPEALLERIIKIASNEDDVILDPFMGGGTTIAVADKLKRQWIGIDQSVMAVKVTDFRLQKQSTLFSPSHTLQLHKYDYNTLRYQDVFEFENWIIGQFGGVSNIKQQGDFGLDGKMPDNTPIQVKRSDAIGRNVVDNFFAAVRRSDKKLYEKNKKEKKPVGYIIAFSFSKGAIGEVARLKNEESTIIQLVCVDEIVPMAMGPSVTIKMRELDRDARGNCVIEFSAKGRSESEISFYTWDFAYDEEERIQIIGDGR